LENSVQAVVGLTVPLYQQGQEYSRLRAQKQAAGQFRNLLDQTERDVIDATLTSWEALQTAHAQWQSYQDQITSARIALEGVQRESQVGSRTVIEVLNAEQELLTAEVNATQAQHDEMVAAYQLLSATGQLNAADLALNVDLYDPAAHYSEVRDQWAGFGNKFE
jgi:outer membrane protein